MRKSFSFSNLSVFALIGFTAVSAQVIFLREFLVVFYGNEISVGIILANWLLWTAAGSLLVGKLPDNSKNPALRMAFLQMLISVATPFTILIIRFSKSFLQATPGEILGFFPAILDSFIILIPFCLISGGLFSAGSLYYKTVSRRNSASASGAVYLLEAIGSGIGGILISLLLISHFPSIWIALLLSFLNILSAGYLTFKHAGGSTNFLTLPAGLIIFILTLLLSLRIEPLSTHSLWKNFNILESKNSIYGNLTLVESHGTRTLFENGLILYNFPGVEAAEETVHYPLLLHPEPKNILLIGGGIAGGVREALKHPSVQKIEYVELDPGIFNLSKRFFPDAWSALRDNPEVLTLSRDGRLFLKQQQQKFDVIIVSLPDPQTAQINRFYTVEFFREAARHLTPSGLLSFQVTSAENYISDELAQFLQCIRKTLRQVFPSVAIMPGPKAHFFAANRGPRLVLNPDTLINRIKKRNLRTLYVSKNFIPFRLMPDRLISLQHLTKPTPGTPENKDFVPIAYYFNIILWSTKFLPFMRRFIFLASKINFFAVFGIFTLALILIVTICKLKLSKERYLMTGSIGAVVVMGFTLMGLEFLLILAFQAIYGYVYQQIAILIASFMTGMALGSWISLKKISRTNVNQQLKKYVKELEIVHLLAVFFPALTFGLFSLFRSFTSLQLTLFASQLAFPLTALFWGTLGGYQFPIASSIFFSRHASPSSNMGILYGMDLIGALLGSLSLSILVVPLFGFAKALILVAVLNSIVVLALGMNSVSSSK